jgi:hypothetical protein
MKFFGSPTPLLLYSDLSPDECARRLSQTVDVPSFTFFSLSNYRGSRPFLGRVNSSHFLLFRRVYFKNIPLVLSGSLVPRGMGTRVEGTFDIRSFWKIWIRLCGISGLIIAYLTRGEDRSPWFDVVFVCSALVIATVGPNIVRFFGLDQQRGITDFLCVQLEAGEDSSAYQSGNES